MEYYRVTDTENLCILSELAEDIKDMTTVMLEEIEDNAPLKRCRGLDDFDSRKYYWNNRSDYVHAMTSALFTMVSELHNSLTELDNICNSTRETVKSNAK